MTEPTGIAPAPSRPIEFGATRLCGSCGRLIREWIQADTRVWRHVAIGAGSDHAPNLAEWIPPLTESEARAMDGDR